MFAEERSPHAKPPVLKTKGGETKQLLPAVQWVFRMANDGTQVHSEIMAALDAMVGFCKLLDCTETFVPSTSDFEKSETFAK
jgi:hypothetical protein